MKFITSRDNALFKQLKALSQDAREIRKQDRTILDGPHLVSVYRDKVGLPDILCLSERSLERDEIVALMAAHAPLVPICLKDSLFREISPTETPVGILSVIRIPAPEDVTSGDALLLDALQDAGNVGTLMRSAAAFGIGNIFLGEGCANAWSPKVLRSAQGAHFSLRIQERCDLQEILRELPGYKLATVVSEGLSLYRVNFSQSAGLVWVIGNEGNGVSSSLLDLCDGRVTIPMSSDSESLNAAVAGSICFAEAARQRNEKGLTG